MTETLHLKVTGMTCGGCENAVKKALMKLTGVEKVGASHASEAVTVDYEPELVTPSAIRASIDALGYQAHVPSN
jgi:copper chaperone CopZ